MAPEAPSLNAGSPYEKFLSIKLNIFKIGEMRSAKSLSFTVTNEFKMYVSLKEHLQVRDEHKFDWHDVALEGRTRRDADGNVKVYLHTNYGPRVLFNDRKEFLTFARAVVREMQKKIDPTAKVPWHLVDHE